MSVCDGFLIGFISDLGAGYGLVTAASHGFHDDLHIDGPVRPGGDAETFF